MTNFTEVASVSSGRPGTFTDQLRLAVAAYRARFKAPPASTPNRTCAATSPGVQSAAWTRSPHGVRTWSSISGGCRRSAGSSLPLCPGGFRSPLGFTAPPSSTASWSTRPLSTSAVPPCPPSPVPAESPTLGFTHLQFEARSRGSHWYFRGNRSATGCDLRCYGRARISSHESKSRRHIQHCPELAGKAGQRDGSGNTCTYPDTNADQLEPRRSTMIATLALGVIIGLIAGLLILLVVVRHISNLV